jgi:hypothetical protein
MHAGGAKKGMAPLEFVIGGPTSVRNVRRQVALAFMQHRAGRFGHRPDQDRTGERRPAAALISL